MALLSSQWVHSIFASHLNTQSKRLGNKNNKSVDLSAPGPGKYIGVLFSGLRPDKVSEEKLDILGEKNKQEKNMIWRSESPMVESQLYPCRCVALKQRINLSETEVVSREK